MMSQVSVLRSKPRATVLQRVELLLPEIAARADEIERAGAVPLDLLDKLQEAGAFRMLVPARFGGAEVPIREATDTMEAVAREDASTAWHLMVAAGSQTITSRLPLASLEEYYANGPDTWPKAAQSPKGIGIPCEGGYRVSGRWPLASGARNFDWVSLGFFIKDADGLRRSPDGKRPDMRVCLVPRANVEVIETWDAVGLNGTRSDDLATKDLFVPEEWQGSVMGKSSLSGGVFGVQMPICNGPFFGSIVMGLLGAAIDELADNALTRKPAFNPQQLMKDDAVFRSRFGELAARADALRALHSATIDVLEQCEREHRAGTPMEAAKHAAAEALIHQEANVLMNEIMMLGGSGAVYSSNIQQRRWRDLRCAAQHQAATIGHYNTYSVAMVEAAEERARRRG